MWHIVIGQKLVSLAKFGFTITIYTENRLKDKGSSEINDSPAITDPPISSNYNLH